MLGYITRKFRMWNPDNYDDRAIGPMGLHDAYLLDAICRYVRPKVALEFGGLLGHSLSVMAEHCDTVISVDDNAHQLLYDAASKYGNVQVIKGDMRTYGIINNGIELDLVLFDASHLYGDNVAAFSNIEPILSPKALILIHDTGDWYTGELPPQWEAFQKERSIFLEHDRKFVRYLRCVKGYSDTTFESSDHLRHGYTILKKPSW